MMHIQFVLNHVLSDMKALAPENRENFPAFRDSLT